MPVPDFQSLMLPVIKSLEGFEEKHTKAMRKCVKKQIDLSDIDEQETYPSGIRIFADRVSWAITYIQRAGLIERVSRGVYKLTQDGDELLKKDPSHVNKKTLREYKVYQDWEAKVSQKSQVKKDTQPDAEQSNEIPMEVLEESILRIRSELEADLLSRLRSGPSGFFEKVVVDLLIAMGYGGGNTERGKVVGGPGDQGFDGTIQEDRLGLDEVYVQAKKYASENNVGAGDLRNFAGAIDAAGTTKGVFFTTSTFTKAANDFVDKSPKRIVLIDGDELARLMVDYNVGVNTHRKYDLKQLDEFYFDQDTE